MDDHRRLAALAVFRELYDSRKDVYDILREFIVEIIISKGLHSFHAALITTELENDFGFRVPEAVVKSVLSNISKDYSWCSKRGQEYTIASLPEEVDPEIKDKYATRQAVNQGIFDRLVKHINDSQESSLTADEERNAINSFCSFLLNEKNGEKYTEQISSFVLAHEDDESFQRGLNEIREGVILYSGITYFGKPLEVKHWKSELIFYLDQEILFNCYGLNGDLFKAYFDDFHRLVKDINTNAKKKFIRLRYFPETKRDMDAFFSSAEMIIRGEGTLRPGNTAMKTILNGCQTASDVREKYTRFYHFLGSVGIRLDDDFVFDESKFPHNILSVEAHEAIEESLGEKAAQSLSILNKIHCLRGGTRSSDFFVVKYHFLTGTEATFRAALHEAIKGTEPVPLASFLDWVTNKFWFKLNRGLEGDRFPISSQVLSKAREVLSTIVNRNVGEKYDELLSQHEAGELSEELAQARIVSLMEQTVRPEDIDSQSIDMTLDFLQRDSLEHFKAEQEASKLRHREQVEENERLRQETGELKADLQRHKDETELNKLSQTVSELEAIKGKADKWCSVWCSAFYILGVLLGGMALWAVHMVFRSLPWDNLEPLLAEYSTLLEVVMFLMLLLGIPLMKPQSWNKKIQARIRGWVYNSHDVCEGRLCKFREQMERLKENLQ